jgi:predicted acyltransferase (DUF342 family)
MAKDEAQCFGGSKGMNEFVAYLACAIGIALPTVPGLIQLGSAKKEALKIDQRYSRDPRYMGFSWRRTVDPIIANATSERVPFLNRKNEFARISGDTTLPNGTLVNDIVLSRGNFHAGKHSSLLDVYAQGEAQIDADSHVRCLAADRNAILGDRSIVTRWVDVGGDLQVGRFCDLGASASAAGTLTVDAGTRFRRMFAVPVAVSGDTNAPAPIVDKGPRRGSTLLIKAGDTTQGDMIVPHDIEVGDGAVVNGSINAGGDIRIGTGAQILGNVIARGSVTAGQRSKILGHIFADRNIAIAAAATVGSAKFPKTVQSTEALQLAPGATVYGWVICERGGTTVVIGA